MNKTPAAAHASANSGALRQQPVPWMDRIGAGKFGDADYFVDRKIGFDRAPKLCVGARATADLISLIGLEPMQRQICLHGTRWQPWRCPIHWPRGNTRMAISDRLATRIFLIIYCGFRINNLC